MRRFCITVVLTLGPLWGSATAARGCPFALAPGVRSVVAVNSQVLEFSTTGVGVEIVCDEISATRIAGLVSRLSGGGRGTVTVRWVSQNLSVVVRLSSTCPEGVFELVPTSVAATTMTQLKSMYR